MRQYPFLPFKSKDASFIILRVSMLLFLFLTLNGPNIIIILILIQLLNLKNNLFLRCVVSEGTHGLDYFSEFLKLKLNISVNHLVNSINWHVWQLQIIIRGDFEFVKSLLEFLHHILQVDHFEARILSSFHIS